MLLLLLSDGANHPDAANEELSVKLESEAMIEKEMRNSDTYSEDIKDYLDNSPFEVRLAMKRCYFAGSNQYAASRHSRARRGGFVSKIQ